MFNTFFREAAINIIILLPGGKQMNMLGVNLSMVVESYHIILFTSLNLDFWSILNAFEQNQKVS